MAGAAPIDMIQVKRYPTKNVLAAAVSVFGLCSAVLLILDAATGGTFMPVACTCFHPIQSIFEPGDPTQLTHRPDRNNHPKNEWPYYGRFVACPDLLIMADHVPATTQTQ